MFKYFTAIDRTFTEAVQVSIAAVRTFTETIQISTATIQKYTTANSTIMTAIKCLL